MRTPFEEQLILTLVDKGALALVVGLAGFIGNRWLERYKTSRALLATLTPERVNRIAARVEASYTLALRIEALRNSMRREILQILGNNSYEESLKMPSRTIQSLAGFSAAWAVVYPQHFAEIDSLSKAFNEEREAVARESFWVDEYTRRNFVLRHHVLGISFMREHHKEVLLHSAQELDDFHLRLWRSGNSIPFRIGVWWNRRVLRRGMYYNIDELLPRLGW